MASMAAIASGLTGSARLNCRLGEASVLATKTSTQSTAVGRVSTHCFTSFLGSGLHASSSSPVFNVNAFSAGRSAALPQRRRRRGENLVVRGLFGLGVPELVVIAGVAAILFGPKKLPEIGKSLGKTVQSFQQAAKEFETAVKNPNAGDVVEAESTNSEKPVPPKPEPTLSSPDKESGA